MIGAHGRALVSELARALGLRRGADGDSPFQVFLTPEANAINRARQDHLASLGFDFAGKSLLEVGAGIGLHTPFFVRRGCSALVTDGNAER
jgi:hypothetical protein